MVCLFVFNETLNWILRRLMNWTTGVIKVAVFVYWPDGVVLYVLGVQAGVKVHDRLEGSQTTVEEQQQKLELSVGGTVRQTLLQDAQRLPHHVLVPWDTPETNVQRRSLKQRRTRNQRERERNSPVSVHKSMYTWAAMRQYMSENCSSVFRAFAPVRQRNPQVRTNCSHEAPSVLSLNQSVPTKLQSVPIVSFELRDEPQLSLHVERVMQPERSAQLTHAQMPLQRFGVVWKRESLVALLAQRNRFTQTVYKLKRGEEQSVSESNTSQEADQQTALRLGRTWTCWSAESRWRYIFRSVMQHGLSPNFPKNCTISSKGSPV